MRERDWLDGTAMLVGTIVLGWGIWGEPADREGTLGLALGILLFQFVRWFADLASGLNQLRRHLNLKS